MKYLRPNLLIIEAAANAGKIGALLSSNVANCMTLLAAAVAKGMCATNPRIVRDRRGRVRLFCGRGRVSGVLGFCRGDRGRKDEYVSEAEQGHWAGVPP